MLYSVNELLENASSTLFIQKGNEFFNKRYKVTALPYAMDENTIFIPIIIEINGKVEDYYLNLENQLKKGIRGFFFDEIRLADEKYRKILFDLLERYKDQIEFVIMTKDTLCTHRELARYTRVKRLPEKTKIIGITGTVGKTTTTEMIYNILKHTKYIFHKDPERNIRFRVCQKLLDVPEDEEFDYLIIEISGASKGYLKFLAELLRVEIAVITKVTIENTGVFGTLEGVGKNKCSLMSCIPNKEGCFAVLDDTELVRKCAEEYDCEKIFVREDGYTLISKDANGSTFIYDGDEYRTTAIGEHFIGNCIKAITLAKRLGIDVPTIQKGLAEKTMLGDRWMIGELNENRTIITDCANNPIDSTMVILKLFLELYGHKKNKRIVISEIRNLGTYARDVYMDLAKHLVNLDIQEAICIHENIECLARYLEENSNIKVTRFSEVPVITKNCELVKYLKGTPMEDEAILVKCSFGLGYEYVAGFLKE